jgi:hypothetical protein
MSQHGSIGAGQLQALSRQAFFVRAPDGQHHLPTCSCVSLRLVPINALQRQVALRRGVHVWEGALQRRHPSALLSHEPPQRRHQHPEHGRRGSHRSGSGVVQHGPQLAGCTHTHTHTHSQHVPHASARAFLYTPHAGRAPREAGHWLAGSGRTQQPCRRVHMPHSRERHQLTDGRQRPDLVRVGHRLAKVLLHQRHAFHAALPRAHKVLERRALGAGARQRAAVVRLPPQRGEHQQQACSVRVRVYG